MDKKRERERERERDKKIIIKVQILRLCVRKQVTAFLFNRAAK